MSTLGALDVTSGRKSRRNSMMMLASQLNLANIEGGENKEPKALGALGGSPKKHIPHSNNFPRTGEDALMRFISALYGKLLVFLGLAFPIAEYFSKDQQSILYYSFYMYLYIGSICFILFSYTILLRTGKSPLRTVIREKIYDLGMFLKPYRPKFPNINVAEQLRHLLSRSEKVPEKEEEQDNSSVSDDYSGDIESNIVPVKPSKFVISEASHGSMYLKIGVVLFGIGSMIYSGLNFGQYFELRADCANILMAITPASRMVFTFLQMYYIFLNSRVSIGRHTTIARYGLMHMLATNLCIWLNVLVEETKHTLHHLIDHHHSEVSHDGQPSNGYDLPVAHNGFHDVAFADEARVSPDNTFHLREDHFAPLVNLTTEIAEKITTAFPLRIIEGLFGEDDDISHNLVKRSADGSECRIAQILGDLVARSSPLLFPCTIEYSLLCAGVVYVMWTNVLSPTKEAGESSAESEISHMIARKFRHHYTVDCARASRGLFVGIFLLVITIITLIFFIVLISNDEFKEFAILQANLTEIAIYIIGITTSIIGMYQMTKLTYHPHNEVELDNILLLVAQAGVYVFSSFTFVSGYFSMKRESILPMVKSVFALTQTTVQTLLILGGTQRRCITAEQVAKKPGREMITFLLVSNLAMWAISTFQTSRGEVHPSQLDFYGIRAWTIISHISMPLAIFYRFHATVCLGEIWKKAYKISHYE